MKVNGQIGIQTLKRKKSPFLVALRPHVGQIIIIAIMIIIVDSKPGAVTEGGGTEPRRAVDLDGVDLDPVVVDPDSNQTLEKQSGSGYESGSDLKKFTLNFILIKNLKN